MTRRVLIVDDSAMIRMQVARALSEKDCEVIMATDGQDAWEKLQEAAEHPNLMVCDVNMPRMNGIELLEQMREGGAYGDIPILMLTTEGQPELIRRAKQLGAKGWLVKPFRADLLTAAFDSLAADGA